MKKLTLFLILIFALRVIAQNVDKDVLKYALAISAGPMNEQQLLFAGVAAQYVAAPLEQPPL